MLPPMDEFPSDANTPVETPPVDHACFTCSFYVLYLPDRQLS
jgi:hypothetical protein